MNTNATKLRKGIILSLLDHQPQAKLLDLGCDDGSWTMKLSEKIGTREIYGVEIVDKAIQKAKEKGIRAYKANLNEFFPFEDNSFDVIHADQVIEHIEKLDNFLTELYRVLKPGGYVVVSTENASSWHNILASIMGWQIFSLTNISSKLNGIGNPLSIHHGETLFVDSWTHKTIFNYLGLKDFFKVYDFNNVKIIGSGYYPLPAVFGKFDSRHAHYITLKCSK